MYTKCSQDMPCSAWFQSFHVTDWSDCKEIYKRKINIALVSIFSDNWSMKVVWKIWYFDLAICVLAEYNGIAVLHVIMMIMRSFRHNKKG